MCDVSGTFKGYFLFYVLVLVKGPPSEISPYRFISLNLSLYIAPLKGLEFYWCTGKIRSNLLPTFPSFHLATVIFIYFAQSSVCSINVMTSFCLKYNALYKRKSSS